MKIIINGKELSENEVKHVVNAWYLNGLCPDIFQSCYGEDLEEYLDVDYSENIEIVK